MFTTRQFSCNRADILESNHAMLPTSCHRSSHTRLHSPVGRDKSFAPSRKHAGRTAHFSASHRRVSHGTRRARERFQFFFSLYSPRVPFNDSVYSLAVRLIRTPVLGTRAIKPRGNEVGGLRNAVLNNDRMRYPLRQAWPRERSAREQDQED